MAKLVKAFQCLVIIGFISVVVPTAASADPASRFVSNIGRDVVDIIQDESLSDNAKEAKLQSIFRDVVDVRWIGRFVLGKYWRTADSMQKERYLDSYQGFLVKNYTSRFREYSGESFDILKSRREGENKYLVTMELKCPKEANVIIDYKLRKENKKYKVYDIVVEGVSLITTQRAEFTSVVSRRGLDFLINALEKRARRRA